MSVKVQLTNEQIKSIQLSILKDIDDFCISNNINYTVFYGTLIGIVRHKGYIPWDDDIDILMTRDNYNTFIQTYKSNRFRVKCFDLDSDFLFTFAKVESIDTVLIENKKYKMELGINVDVFPLDGLPEKGVKHFFHVGIARILYFLINIKQIKDSKKRSLTKRFLLACLQLFLLPFSYKALIKFSLKHSRKYPLNTSKYGANLSWLAYGKNDIIEIQKVKVCERKVFENIEVNVTRFYDDILKHIYGNYMELPPVEKRVTHHNFKVFSKV